jgi:hypothetical protein
MDVWVLGCMFGCWDECLGVWFGDAYCAALEHFQCKVGSIAYLSEIG